MTKAQPSKLHVIAGGGIAVPLKVIVAEFERATGRRVIMRFGTVPELVKLANAPEPIDLCVVPQDMFLDRAASARFAGGARPIVARAGIGLAVRKGRPKPDISTPETLKRTLLAATSVASIPASATGSQLAAIYEQLGIGEAMTAKTRAQAAPGGIAEAVVSGEAELAVFLINVLSDPRLDVVGPFPPAIQRHVVYEAAPAAAPGDAEAAAAFIAHVLSQPAARIIQACGMEPGSAA